VRSLIYVSRLQMIVMNEVNVDSLCLIFLLQQGLISNDATDRKYPALRQQLLFDIDSGVLVRWSSNFS